MISFLLLVSVGQFEGCSLVKKSQHMLMFEADVITICHMPVPGILCYRAQLCVSIHGEHIQQICKHFADIKMLLY